MRVLSIGNSFSQDAHRWLHTLAAQNGLELEAWNLYIGGCSLELHWKNLMEERADYELEINGLSAGRMISIQEALASGKWDVITLQQASPYSGIYETYEPYLTVLADAARGAQGDAELYFHQTWAYEWTMVSDGFAGYGNDQLEMFRRILQASHQAAEKICAPLIPVGEMIQKLREELPEFRVKEGGISLCRDGYHLSLDYGRYAAAATWLHTLTHKPVQVFPLEDFSLALLQRIADVVNQDT